jgi:hypothetical protein
MQNNQTGERIFLASLRQSIGDVLPDRINVYEPALTPARLGQPGEAAAAVAAVFESLQDEGVPVDIVTRRAGEYAAARSYDELCASARGLLRVLPYRMRARLGSRLVERMLSQLGTETAVVTRRGSTVLVDLQGSHFFSGRAAGPEASCAFYGSAIETFFGLCRVDAAVRPGKNRAPRENGCLLLVMTDKARAAAAKGSILGLAKGSAPKPAPAAAPVPPPVAAEPQPLPAPADESAAPEAAQEPGPVVEPEITEPVVELEVAEIESLRTDDEAPERPQPEELDRTDVELRWDAIPPPPTRARTRGPRRASDPPAPPVPAGTADDPDAEWDRL